MASVHVVGNITTNGAYAGGLLGQIIVNEAGSSVVSNSSVSGSFNTPFGYYLGGLVGDVNISGGSTLINDNNTVLVGQNNYGRYIGGLFGTLSISNNSTVLSRNNTFSSPLLADNALKVGDSYAGGFVGAMTLYSGSKITIDGFKNYSDVRRIDSNTNAAYLGGLAGNVDLRDDSSLTLNQIQIGQAGGRTSVIDSGNASWTGGLIGYLSTSSSATLKLSNSDLNVKVSGQSYQGGLVGQTQTYDESSLSISGLTLTNAAGSSMVSGTGERVGGLIGDVTQANNSRLNIDTTSMLGHVNSSSYYAGGLIGYHRQFSGSGELNITNSQVGDASHAVTITGSSHVGGALGYTESTANSSVSFNQVQVNAGVSTSNNDSHIGGLIGRVYATDSSSFNVQNIAIGIPGAAGAYVRGGNQTGGVIGSAEAYSNAKLNFSDISVLAPTTGNSNVAGVLGSLVIQQTSAMTMKRISVGSTATVTSTGRAGGIIGDFNLYNDSSANFDVIASSADITGSSSVGGLFGNIRQSGSINNQFNLTNSSVGSASHAVSVTGTSDGIGGAVGYIYGDSDSNAHLENVNINANVTGARVVAGAIGHLDTRNNMTLTLNEVNVGATIGERASITGTSGGYVGGLVGYAYLPQQTGLEITNSSVLNNVIGQQPYEGIGGLVGNTDQFDSSHVTIENVSYGGQANKASQVSGGKVGGLIGAAFVRGVTTLDITNATVGSELASSTQITNNSFNYTGGALGEIYMESNGSVNLSNIAVNAQVSSSDGRTGGVIGLTTLNHSTKLTADHLRFGVAGDSSSKVTGSYEVGGIFGSINHASDQTLSLSNLEAYGQIRSTGHYAAGGIVGQSSHSNGSTVSFNQLKFGSAGSATDKVTSDNIYSGGLFGRLTLDGSTNLTLTNASAFGHVHSNAGFAGGIFGELLVNPSSIGSISNISFGSANSTTDKVTSNQYTGGIAASLFFNNYTEDTGLTIEKARVFGEIRSENNYAGGFFGTLQTGSQGKLTVSNSSFGSQGSTTEKVVVTNNAEGYAGLLTSFINIQNGSTASVNFNNNTLSAYLGNSRYASLTGYAYLETTSGNANGNLNFRDITARNLNPDSTLRVIVNNVNQGDAVVNVSNINVDGKFGLDLLSPISNFNYSGNLTATQGASFNFNLANGSSFETPSGTSVTQITGPISIASNNALNFTLNNSRATELGSVNVSQLSVNSNGAITQTGTVSIGDSLDLRANGNDITLDNADNNLGNQISVSSAGNVALTSQNSSRLSDTTISGDLRLDFGGTNASDPNSDSGVITVGGNTYLKGGNNTRFNFNNTANQFSGTINIDAPEVFNISNSGNLNIRSNGALNVGVLYAGGDISVKTLSGDISLNNTITSTDGAVKLVAADNFINNAAGSEVISVGTGKNFSVYSSSPENNTEGNISYDFRQYNANEQSTVLGTGNGFFYTVAPSVGVSTTQSLDKVYDGTRSVSSAIVASLSLTGVLSGDEVTLSGVSTLTYDSANAGARTVSLESPLQIASASNNGRAVYGYQVDSSASSLSGTINKATLEVSTNNGTISKVYDGSTAVNTASAGISLTGLVSGENISVTGLTGQYATKNVGENRGVSLNLDAATFTAGANTSLSNYVLPSGSVDTNNGQITPKALTATAVTSQKVYDGTRGADINSPVQTVETT
ncbi:MAG: YDG domain-containing protein [Burkholderiales bacterium]|nr:YDG domain-containing protein [Burkholderiales bacterium]